MAYDNKLSGLLGRNERKQQPNHPDFTGSCEMEDGRQYWISGWVKDGKPGSKMEGKRFFSLSFKPKDGGGATTGGAQAARPSRGATPPTQQPSRAPAATHTPVQETLDDDIGY